MISWAGKWMADTGGVQRNCQAPCRREQKASFENRSLAEEQGPALESSQKNGPDVWGHICSRRRFVCPHFGLKMVPASLHVLLGN